MFGRNRAEDDQPRTAKPRLTRTPIVKKLTLALLLGVSLAGALLPHAQAATGPCEDMLKQLRDAEAAAINVTDANKAAIADLEAKGIERCNADDDKRADDFFTQALNILGM